MKKIHVTDWKKCFALRPVYTPTTRVHFKFVYKRTEIWVGTSGVHVKNEYNTLFDIITNQGNEK